MIVDKQFHNIKCDACGRMIDEEMWWDDKDALTTQILNECNWIECECRTDCRVDHNIVEQPGSGTLKQLQDLLGERYKPKALGAVEVISNIHDNPELIKRH